MYWRSLSSSFRKKEQELDGQKKVTRLLLPIDFTVPFSGSLVSRNYSSAFSGSLGWDISHWGGLTVPRSPRGRLKRWLSDNTSVGVLESMCFIVELILVVYYFLMTPVLAHMRLWDLKKLIYFCWNIDFNVVLVAGIQWSDSVIHIHISILFQILFPYRLLQNTEYSSLCYIVGFCWLSILCV